MVGRLPDNIGFWRESSGHDDPCSTMLNAHLVFGHEMLNNRGQRALHPL